MRLLDSASISPPTCPPWCVATHKPGAWDTQDGAITKTCYGQLGGIEPHALIRAARFAAIENGCLRVDAPSISVEASGHLERVEALHLAELIIRTVASTAESAATARAAG